MSRPALALVGLEADDLPDVQAEVPAIAIALDEAGITGLRYPVTIHLTNGTTQATVGKVSIAANVASGTRGVHMSRFVECLHAWHRQISVATFADLLADIAERSAATSVVARLDFPIFLERSAPVSGNGALVAYDCAIVGRLTEDGSSCELITRIPITSLCPCSREISDYGAHNQRGAIEASVIINRTPEQDLDFVDVIELAGQSGSAPIYSLLKRTDERYVTMQAYENPAFVEDIARAVAVALQDDVRIVAGRIRVVNEESIHAHDAYAAVNWTRT